MTRPYYYYFLLFFCLTACQPDDTTPDINIDISDELRIELWEILDANQRMLELRVSTLEELDCENYSISFNLNQTASRSAVSINNILPPHECIPGTAPASNQIELGHFLEGDYAIELNLKNNDITNIGRLKIKPRFYELDMESDYGIYLPWKILKTVPEDLVWGYLTIEESADENTILDEFNTRITPWTETVGLSSGNYGYFNVENGTANEIKDQDQNETITNNLFLLKEVGVRTELKAALDDLRSEFGNQATIKVFSSDGSFL